MFCLCRELNLCPPARSQYTRCSFLDCFPYVCDTILWLLPLMKAKWFTSTIVLVAVNYWLTRGFQEFLAEKETVVSYIFLLIESTLNYQFNVWKSQRALEKNQDQLDGRKCNLHKRTEADFHCWSFLIQVKLYQANNSAINSVQPEHFLLFTICIIIIIIITYLWRCTLSVCSLCSVMNHDFKGSLWPSTVN